MRLLFFSWGANNEQILADNLVKLEFEVIWFRKECKNYTRDIELAMEMIQRIHTESADAVISFNYFPIISMVCNTCQVPYYAWVYDCPHFTLYAKHTALPCNHIGLFDKEMVRQLGEYGIRTIYHVPLSADTEYFDNVIARASGNEREKYRCDVSFVGSLYTDEHNYYDLLCLDKNEIQSPADADSSMEAVIKQQCFSYEKDYLKQAVFSGKIDMQALRLGMEQQGLMLGEDYFAKPEDILMAAVLEKKVTVEERRTLLKELIGQFVLLNGEKDGERQSSNKKRIDFRLYTGSDTKMLPELDVCNRGRVDYHTQMPLVFAGSKINLNITLRSIHAGIPLRVLDIMACGGFVLTNWQPEIAEYFKEGEEIVIFESLEECLEKVGYYLLHEEKRQQIAAAGRKKVQEMFSYQSGIGRLFGI